MRTRLEFNFAGKPAIVGGENILCENHLRASATPCGLSAAYENQALQTFARSPWAPAFAY